MRFSFLDSRPHVDSVEEMKYCPEQSLFAKSNVEMDTLCVASLDTPQVERWSRYRRDTICSRQKFHPRVKSEREDRRRVGVASSYMMTRQNVVGSLYSTAVNPLVRWVLPDPNQVADILLGSKRR